MPLPAILAALAPYLAAAGAGAAAGGLFGRSGEQPARNQQVPRFNPQQQSALNQLLQQGLSGAKNTQKPFDFGPIEQQARSGFEKQTVPGLAERFTSLGGTNTTGSALSSPAFASQLGQAGAGLEQSLAALKSQIGLQQQGRQDTNTQNLLKMGLSPQFENQFLQREPGFLENLSPWVLQALSTYLGRSDNGLGALGGLGGGQTSSSTSQGLGGTPVYGNYGSGFANPGLQSPEMQNLLRPF